MTNYEYLYNKEYYHDILYHDLFVNKELSYSIIENGTILPFKRVEEGNGLGGGIIDDKGNFINSTSLHNEFGTSYHFDKVEKSQKLTVIYLGMFHSIWGHCLTDNIRRLWFLKTDSYRKQFKDCPLVFIPLGKFKFQENFQQLLEILGIDCKRFIPITEITQYERIILPDECFFTPDGGMRYFTSEYRKMMDLIREYGLEHRKPIPYKKVYFSYANYKKFKQIGEDRIEEYFKGKGFTVITPEKISFKEQLNILVNCESFASTIGSCSHNIVFLRDNTEVILIPRANYLTGYQLALDQVHNLNITYVDSTLSLLAAKAPWDGPFYYFISKQLMHYFNEEIDKGFSYWHKNFKDIKTYIQYGLNYGRGG